MKSKNGSIKEFLRKCRGRSVVEGEMERLNAMIEIMTEREVAEQNQKQRDLMK